MSDINSSMTLSCLLGVDSATLPFCVSERWDIDPSLTPDDEIRKCIIALAMVFRDRQITKSVAIKAITGWSHNEVLAASEVERVYESDEQLYCQDLMKIKTIADNCDKGHCDYPKWRTDFNFIRLENKKKEAINKKFQKEEEPPVISRIEDDGEKKESVSTKLTRLAKLNCDELWHTPDGRAYITLHINGHKEYKVIDSKPVKTWLSRLASDFLLETVSANNLKSVVMLLEGVALYDGKEYELHVRKAEVDGKIYVDIGDASWRVIEISKDGWQIVDDCPVKFYRPRSLLPLPIPELDGDINDFKQIVNVSEEDTWIRYTAWLTQVFWCKGSFVHLHVRGPQGSAKSGLAENTKAVSDPSRAPKRHLPKAPRELMMAGQNESIPSFDNVSEFSDEIADTICIMSTGGSSAARELYTDSNEAIIYSKNPIIMNGIADPSQRGDLIDRLMILDLNSIAEENRVSEKEMQARLNKYAPKLLGVLLDATVTGLINFDKVVLNKTPRMADFTQWAVACSGVMGWKPEKFLEIYQSFRSEAQVEMAESNGLMRAIERFAEAKGSWEGTSTELLNELNTQEHILPGYEPEDWPRKAQNMGTDVRRLVQPAESQGIAIKSFRSGGKNLLEIRYVGTAQSKLGVPSTEKVHNENNNGVTCVPCVSFLEREIVYRKKEEAYKGSNKEKKTSFGFEPTQPTQAPPITESADSALREPTQTAYTPIYITAEIGKFTGIDGRDYGPFRPDEVASIPEIQAKGLANRGVARLIGV